MDEYFLGLMHVRTGTVCIFCFAIPVMKRILLCDKIENIYKKGSKSDETLD